MFFLRLLIIMTSLLTMPIFALKIGLLVVATGKYTHFIPPLVNSARIFFCKDHEVTFFIFTDGTVDVSGEDIILLDHKKYGWPYDTLYRYNAYINHRDRMQKMDYLFACDADMLFVDYVGDEVLSDLVGTQHPGFVGKRGTYEDRPESIAYVASHEGEYYFAGAFYGGKREIIFEMLDQLISMVNIDAQNNIIAIWHDESYMNRYFIDRKPSLVLPHAYCARPFDYPQKIVALDKNHVAFRIGSQGKTYFSVLNLYTHNN